MQLTFRRRFTHGVQFDLNYTLAKGKDHGSQVERGSAFDNFGSGGYSGFLVNSFEPDLNYSYSDFDVRHQINVNWLAELPFGQGKHWGSGAGTVTNAIIGDWSVAGIGRWSSGYPFNVINCRSCWATNWNLQGNAALAQPGVLPETETTRATRSAASQPVRRSGEGAGGVPEPVGRSRHPQPAARRRLLHHRLSIGKGSSCRRRSGWNSAGHLQPHQHPKFDTGDVTMFPDSAASFGRYDSSLAACDGAAGRCMQLNLRYTFWRVAVVRAPQARRVDSRRGRGPSGPRPPVRAGRPLDQEQLGEAEEEEEAAAVGREREQHARALRGIASGAFEVTPARRCPTIAAISRVEDHRPHHHRAERRRS
jgi:hypothetical protein